MKPTKRQIEALENLGVPIPPTKGSANGIIGYIKHGTRTKGKTFNERVAITKAYHTKWLSKEVKLSTTHYPQHRGKTGKVLYLIALGPEQAKIARTMNSNPHPFRAIVKLNTGERLGSISFYYLEII